MSQSFVQFYSHIVFHTKNNKKLIKKSIQNELYSYLGGILKNYRSNPFQIGGVEDHVHILCTLPKTITLADLVEEIKKSSSKWIKSKGSEYNGFYWQDGYAAFSVGWPQTNMVCNYINNQEAHHKRLHLLMSTGNSLMKMVLNMMSAIYDPFLLRPLRGLI